MSAPKVVTLIVLDSVGIGELPDAADFGDQGSDTLGNLAAAMGGLRLPNLAAAGLGNIPRKSPLRGVPAASEPLGSFGKLASKSQGKDTATGHWEMMGLVLKNPLRTYPGGFPEDMIAQLCAAMGVDGVLGNRADSGTAIIDALGADHMQSGHPIIYTSADPVLQIAAHEQFGIDKIYAWCEAAYPIAIEAGLGRVIARPFIGEPGSFQRTHRRRDYALVPPEPTMLDELAAAGKTSLGVGKISSIFSGRGIDKEITTEDNADGIRVTLDAMLSREYDFVFTNLVDFDMLYGHRRDPEGYARCLEEFDAALPGLIAALKDDDLLLITADHGNDPTYRGSDHTREYIPVLAIGAGFKPGHLLGVGETFADIGATVLHHFGLETARPLGTPFKPR